MASSLSKFLELDTEKLSELQIQTIPVTCKDGTELEIDIRELSTQQFKKVKIRSGQAYTNSSNGQQVVQVEEVTLALEACALGIVAPSLANTKLRAKFRAQTPQDVVLGLFDTNEILRIGGLIIGMSFDSGETNADSGVDEKLLDEAKN